MTPSSNPKSAAHIKNADQFAQLADYSLMDQLTADPQARADGEDHQARQVFSGHFVPVTPTPLPDPAYISHSPSFFQELGLSDALLSDADFCRLFSGDLSAARAPLRPTGWATGYALSIYGTEYTQQCPFGTGNGYGDGRAISVFEGVINGKRWEMQLKGGGPTPYCRGADGRAVLRSSLREFLAQEHMHALGVPTSRSLTLFVSQSETVTRPWYSQGSRRQDPDIRVANKVAITTRVAPSFLRVGQLELFARRLRNKAHANAYTELRQLVEHLINREYRQDIDPQQPFSAQVVALALHFRQRLTTLIAHWLRVGYCQGNFNSDNCAAGGFTLDYGPFGFCELFDSDFQPWTGGGQHFAFFNQPAAAQANYRMFWASVRLLLENDTDAQAQLDDLYQGFAEAMQQALQTLWASKLGLAEFDAPLTQQLLQLMHKSAADYTLFFRELSQIPASITDLKKSFYRDTTPGLDAQWTQWLQSWRAGISQRGDALALSAKMKRINPKYTWREWLVVPAYQAAADGDYSLLKTLQTILSDPYSEQSSAIEKDYYRLRPEAYCNVGGISHYSCSS